jgi:methyl-accepting chemotaxis protein
MLQRLKIKTRLTIGFAALVLLIVALTAVTTISSTETAQSVAESKRLATIVIGLKTALLSVRQGRVMTWSYLATGEDSYLKGRDTAFDQYRTDYDALMRSVQTETGRQLSQEFNNEVLDFEAKAKTVNALKAKGTPAGAPDYAAALSEVNQAAKHYTETNDKASAYFDGVYQNRIAAADAQTSLSRTLSMIGGALGVLIGSVTAFLIGRSIVQPVRAITSVMDEMAKGDLTVQIPAADNTDEIGDMAKSLAHFKNGLLKAQELISEQQAQREAREKRGVAIETMTKTFEGQVSQLLSSVSGALTELETTASAMSANSEQTSRQANAVASATEEASANVQTVATAAEELSASIQEIGRQVEQSARVTQTASEEARHSVEVVNGLAESSAKIGTVVNLISGIASQTNLLALNATIEAARAGEAGKGFAVVAGEVKDLANQTARATGEIEAQIAAVQASTQDAVSAIGGIVSRIGEINEIAAAIAAAVEEQLAATGEIARNVQQAARGTQDVANTIGGVTQAAQETGSAASRVLASTRSLNGETASLKDSVSMFLGNVRSA